MSPSSADLIRFILTIIVILAVPAGAFALSNQLQISAGYNPQVNISDIDFPYLSTWDGFFDLPFFGARYLRRIHNEWYIFSGYRYTHKTSGLPAGNAATLNYHVVTIGPYYRSPTTEAEKFFINLVAGAGISLTSFEPDIAGVTDKLDKTDFSAFVGLGMERMLFSRFSAVLELNYNFLDTKVVGTFGTSPTPVEVIMQTKGFDLALGIGCEF
ncbi:MAG: outer membrane beta-barrel protein [candidate division Zixibacteria bacterium]|nr:outer membrane beta-barrel protein [candidate division Zixibacteria bacterium]